MPLRRLQDAFLLLLAALLVLPVLAVLASWLQSTGQTAQILGEMSRTVLPGYVWTTLWLCLWVGAGVAVVGMASAAAVTLFDFPGRRLFEWVLLLPLAMPAYVVAYAYTDSLQFSGPVQGGIRSDTFVGRLRGERAVRPVQAASGQACGAAACSAASMSAAWRNVRTWV